MTTVIENYNNTPNTALDGITPNQALLKANQKIIFKFNLLIQKGKQEPSDLIIGDKVRISLAKGRFVRSSSPQFSDEFYTVYLVKGSNVKLDNMKTYKRYSLLKVVNPNQKIIVVNPFKEHVRNKKADTVLKELHGDDKPFVELRKRDRKQNVLMNIGHKK